MGLQQSQISSPLESEEQPYYTRQFESSPHHFNQNYQQLSESDDEDDQKLIWWRFWEWPSMIEDMFRETAIEDDIEYEYDQQTQDYICHQALQARQHNTIDPMNNRQKYYQPRVFRHRKDLRRDEERKKLADYQALQRCKQNDNIMVGQTSNQQQEMADHNPLCQVKRNLSKEFDNDNRWNADLKKRSLKIPELNGEQAEVQIINPESKEHDYLQVPLFHDEQNNITDKQFGSRGQDDFNSNDKGDLISTRDSVLDMNQVKLNPIDYGTIDQQID